MKHKKFFSDGKREWIGTKKYWVKVMKQEKLDELILNEQQRVIGSEFNWCKEVMLMGEKIFCGEKCGGYTPCNGKNGKCKKSTWIYEDTGRKFKLTKNKFELVKE